MQVSHFYHGISGYCQCRTAGSTSANRSRACGPQAHIIYMLHISGILHIDHILHSMYIVHKLHIYAYNAYLACIIYVAYRCILCQYCYFVLPPEQEKCCGGGVGGGGGGCGACRATGRPRRGPARAAPLGRQTRANPHELASNEECTRTCCGRACLNGTRTARNPASWNGPGRNIHKYTKNMQLYVKLCLKYANI